MREYAFWVAVLLALPACSLIVDGPDDPDTNLARGDEPRSAAVFCDIEVLRRCATEDDKRSGIPFAEAAVALVNGRNSATNVGLDYSPAARMRCGDEPEAVVFHAAYPTGLQVCVNCAEAIGPGKPYANALEVCRAQCHDLTGGSPQPDGSLKPKVPPTEETIDSCAARTRVSTNASRDGCVAGACTSLGTPTAFADPRRVAEPVVWRDLIDVATSEADGIERLVRITDPTGEFDAGAVSEQWLRHGSGWVEFSLNRTDRAVSIGFSELSRSCASPDECPETDPSRANLHFGLALGPDALVYVLVRGSFVANGTFESWGPYAAGERFRVGVRQHAPLVAGFFTGTVYFARVPPGCGSEADCPVAPFYTHDISAAAYPLRVKASIRDQGVRLTDVRVVRIK